MTPIAAGISLEAFVRLLLAIDSLDPDAHYLFFYRDEAWFVLFAVKEDMIPAFSSPPKRFLNLLLLFLNF